jgi:1-acyl-sn-glycerol-3-phosphate acyltransferase
VFVALPVIDRGRIVHFFALMQDFERPILGWGLRRTGQIPIRRGFGDWEAIETSARVLQRGMLAMTFLLLQPFTSGPSCS